MWRILYNYSAILLKRWGEGCKEAGQAYTYDYPTLYYDNVYNNNTMDE